MSKAAETRRDYVRRKKGKRLGGGGGKGKLGRKRGEKSGKGGTDHKN